MQIAKQTVEDQGFIDILSRLGKDFCFHLNYNIIPSQSQQKIKAAETDGQALYEIRQVDYQFYILSILK